MGFFGKIKDNLTHGGVDVSLQSSGVVPLSGTYACTVQITAKKAPQTVKSISLRLIREERKAGTVMSFGSSQPSMTFGTSRAGRSSNELRVDTIAEMQNTEPFALAAGETKAIQLNLTTGSGQAVEVSGAFAAIAGIAKGLEKLAGHGNAVYKLNATVDVDGIALDPSASQTVQVQEATTPTTTPGV